MVPPEIGGVAAWLAGSRLFDYLDPTLLALLVVAIAWLLGRLGANALGRALAAGPFQGLSGGQVKPLQELASLLFRYALLLLALPVALGLFGVKLLEAGDWKILGGAALKTVLILLAAGLASRMGRILAGRVFEAVPGTGGPGERRARTLSSLLGSAMNYLIYFLAGAMILEAFNVKTGSILASVGFVGLALGIGAQSLVRDVINGFFIILENQFTVGEYVTAGGVTGTVEEVGFRTTRIREWTGQLHIIPNGEVTRVANYNRGRMLAVVSLAVAYEEDLERVLDVLRRACQELQGKAPGMLAAPVVQGAVDFGENGVVVRVIADAEPCQQWAVERELRLQLKGALDGEGIAISYPHRVIAQEYRPAREQEGGAGPEVRPGGRGAT